MGSVNLINNRRSILFGAIVIFLLVIGWSMLGKSKHNEHKKTSEQKPISVQAITVVDQTISDKIWASGTVSPYAQAQLAPRIMSNVDAVYVREGDHVKAGQILVRLEAKDLAAQTSSAKAAVASAESMRDKANAGVELQIAQTKANIANAEAAVQIAKQQLSMLKEGPRNQEKNQAKLAVIQAEAQYKNAETELGRMTHLYDQGVISKQKLDETQTQYAIVKAQLDIAKQQAEMSEEGGRSQDIRAAQQRLEQAEQTLRLAKAAAIQNKMARREAKALASMVSQAKAGESSAKVMLGYATIIAPFPGVVTARYVDPGDTASPGVPIIVVEDDSLYRLEANVASQEVSKITPGMSVNLEIGSDKRKGTGKVSLITPTGDPSTRKFIVKIDIPKSLKPKGGDFGRAAFTQGYAKGIVIPKSAVHDLGGIINVFVAGNNNRTDMRIVRVGRSTSDGVEIITGLRAGDKVITKSSVPLEDDVPIKIEGSSHE